MDARSTSRGTCTCWCHAAPDGIWFPLGVSVLDVIEAAAACDCCKARHCEALLSRRLANAPAPRVIGRWVDPEPPKKSQGDGEGDDGN